MTTRRLTLERILEATLALGIDVASTSAVARALGVEQPALYRYVRSKAELVDLACAHALADLDGWTPAARAEDAVHGFQAALWERLAAVDGLARVLSGSTTLPTPLQAAAERLVAAVSAAGLSLREAVLVVDGVTHLTVHAQAGAARLDDPAVRAAWTARSDAVAPAVRDAVRELETADQLALVQLQAAYLLAGARAR